MERTDLISALNDYRTPFDEEQQFVTRFLELLKHPDCYKRSLESGHITASCWITEKDLSHVLMMHHRKLDRWLQPGGHADGDENVIRVASKEMFEETGITTYDLYSNAIFDLDIHPIPERKDVPEHEHFDVRFHFIATDPTELRQNMESKGLKWLPLNEVSKFVANERSITRMVEKTLRYSA